MKTEDNFHGLIASIYEAGVNPDRWENVLQEIASWFGGVGALVGYTDIANNAGGVPVSYNLDPEVLKTYETQYHSQDVWASNCLRYKEGSVVTSDMLVNRTSLVKSEVYNDYLQKMDVHDLLAVSLANDKSAVGFLSVYRSAHVGGFQSSEIGEMEIFAGHLQTAVKISSKMSQKLSNLRSHESIFDRLSYPVIVINSDRCLLSANQAAEELLSKGDGLSVRSGKVHAVYKHDTENLMQCIKNVLAPNLARSGRDNSLIVRRYPDRDFYGLTLMPLCAKSTADVFPLQDRMSPTVAVWISEPTANSILKIDTFALQYGLTQSQSKILAHLIQHSRIVEVAERLGLSQETVRTHVKAIFQKTATNSQAQLISKTIAAIPPSTPRTE